MGYLILILYLLGCYMQLLLGQNILKLKDGDTHEFLAIVIVCLLWPITACWYLLKKISGRND